MFVDGDKNDDRVTLEHHHPRTAVIVGIRQFFHCHSPGGVTLTQ